MDFKSKKNINIVLIEPEIPNNTGNIGRTCVALGATLHLVGPLGFDLDEKKVRRAGLDYWPHLKLERYDSQAEFFEKLPKSGKKAFFTTKAELYHFDCKFSGGEEDVWLIYGKETKGLSADVLKAFPEDLYKIPMPGQTRSLNLANSVAIGAYEAFRQIHT
jgi:tRNA (cytidine/uridine-2'-O-)-methyltransferase